MKNIIQRHTNEDNKFNISTALIEQEEMIKSMAERISGLEEAIAFFAKWWNDTQDLNRVSILLPEHMINNKKIIL